MRYLKTNTATIVTVGPFLDKTDGVTLETALTITNERISLTVDLNDGNAPTLVLDNVTGATSGTSNDLNYITNNDAGLMQLELAAANVNYLGRAFLTITDAANHCPVFHEFMILPAMVFDSLIAGTDVLQADMTQILGTAVSTPATAGLLDVNAIQLSGDATAANNAESFFDGTGYAGTNNVIPLVTTTTTATNLTNLPAAAATAAELAKVPKSDSTVSWNATALAAINAEVDTALNTAIPGSPTADSINERVATMDGTVATNLNAPVATVDTVVDGIATTLGAAGAGLTVLATAANLATLAGYVDTEMAAVLAAVDTEVAAIKAKTDNLPAAPASTTNITAGTITTVTNLTNAPTAGDLTATMKASVTTAATAATPIAASVTGAVGSVTAPVTAGTVSDKTGYALSSAGVQAIWDALTSALTTAGSVGKRIADYLDAAISSRGTSTYAGGDTSGTTTLLSRIVGTLAAGTHNPQTGDGFARLGAPAGASVSADIASVKTDTGTTLPANLTLIDDYLDTEIAAIKAKTDTIPANPAAVGSAMILTSAYDAAKTAATQTSVDDLPTNAELAMALGTADDAVLAAIAALNNLSSAGAQSAASAALTAYGAALQTSVDDLEGRLTATRAGYLDNLSGGAVATAAALAIVAGYVDTEVAAILASVDTEVAAIKAKTDNLPADPADQSAVEAAITAATSSLATASALATLAGYVDTEVAAILTAVDTEVAAIKAVTDKLDTALELDGAVYRYTINALEQAPAGGGGSGATAVDIRIEMDANSTKLAAILEDTSTTLPASIAGLDDLSSADVQAAATASLTAYDPPTKAELDAAVAELATAAALAVLDEVADAILADTGTTLPSTLATINGNVLSRTSLGAGAIAFTYTLTTISDGSPIADADVWVTTDAAGSNLIAAGRTNANGQIVFYLDAGTVYIWRQKSGWAFANPDTEVVA